MASKEPDENCNTETEEETIALMRKRARRVSFAETTAVHFFDRDEESDKRLPTTEAADEDWLRRTESEEIRVLLQANGVSAEEEDDDDDEVLPSKPFFRPIESPSPASSSAFGSATSNDEENFFGPISADFIKHRLSNSAGDDENHDITMDSTTFSMHFRSLAKSDSGGDIKTPTGFRLAFGESSPTQTAKSNVGNSMVLTRVKSPIVHPSLAVERSTGSCNSNDMSLVKENSDRFDYGRLSPGLDALLTEGQKDVVAVPSCSQLEGSISIDYPKKDSECDGVHQNGTPLNLMDHTPKIPTEPVSPSHVHEEETNVPYAQSPADQRMQDIFFNEECSPMIGKLSIDTNPVQMNDVSAGQESVRNAEKIRKRKAEFDQLAPLSDLNSENEVGPFLMGSISSLNAKKRQIFKDLTSSSDHLWNSALLQKQPGSFHKKGNDRIILSLPPLPGKSISRLKWLKNSPSASFYGEGVNHPRVTTSGTASKSYSKTSILDGKTLNHQYMHVDVPVACLEEQFSSASSEKKNMNSSDFQMLDQTVAMRQRSRVGNVIEDDRLPIPTTGSFSSKEGTFAGASPLQIRSLGKQDNEHLSSTVNAAEVNLLSSGSDSSLLEVTLNDRKYMNSLPSEMDFEPAILESPSNSKTLSEIPNQLYMASSSKDGHSIATTNTAVGSSSVTEEGMTTSECMEYQQSNLETPKQPLTFALKEGGNSIATVKEEDNSTSETENPGLLINNGISESGLASKLNAVSEIRIQEQQQPSVNLPPTGSGELRCTYPCPDLNREGVSEIRINGQKTVLKDIQLNGQTPVRHGVSEQHQFNSSNKSIRTASRTTLAGEELPVKSQSYQQEQYIHSSKEERCSSVHDNEVLKMKRTDDPTLSSYQLSLDNACSNFQNAFDMRNESYSLKMKNLGGKLGAEMEEAVDILHKHQHFLNDSNQAGELHSGSFNGISTVTQNTEGDKRRQSLTDVLRNFNLLTGKWLSSSVKELDTHSVEKLEDIMATLQKFASSKISCSNIYSQKLSGEFNHALLKRVAETKLLMYKAMYGRVKMQLMHLKKKKFLNQIELVQSAVQESKVLRSKCCCKLHGSDQDNVLGGCNSQSYSTYQDKNKDKGKSIPVLEKALEDSKRKIEILISSFHTSIKMPGQPNCDMTVAIVMDHLKRKAPCWFLQQEFQLWEVDKAENKNGQLDFVLNYDGIFSQRFKLKHKPKSSISISSELINTGISKTWPRMNAAAAFEFVLSGKTILKYTGPVIFARETQRISSLLSNLCDVLEEIKLAHIELSNLAKSSFHLPSVGRLVLQLTFINYNDGRRVILSFDVSCLSCGVYPSDIIPYEVGDASNVKQKPITESILDEIKSAIGGLRGGYLRLLRLCRCVSNVVQLGSNKR